MHLRRKVAPAVGDRHAPQTALRLRSRADKHKVTLATTGCETSRLESSRVFGSIWAKGYGENLCSVFLLCGSSSSERHLTDCPRILSVHGTECTSPGKQRRTTTGRIAASARIGEGQLQFTTFRHFMETKS